MCAISMPAASPNVRTYQTTERQHFRTDSCDIVALLCPQKTAKSGGMSSFVGSMAIYNAIATRRPDLVGRLFQTFPTDRRGEVPAGKALFRRPGVQRLSGLSLGHVLPQPCIHSSARFPDARRLTRKISTLHADMFDDLANDADFRLDMTFEPGDMQFLHNHTILHDRTAFVDWAEPEKKRHLLRLWLAAPGARPLPPIYAERYGTPTVGDRGGREGAHALDIVRAWAPPRSCRSRSRSSWLC